MGYEEKEIQPTFTGQCFKILRSRELQWNLRAHLMAALCCSLRFPCTSLLTPQPFDVTALPINFQDEAFPRTLRLYASAFVMLSPARFIFSFSSLSSQYKG